LAVNLALSGILLTAALLPGIVFLNSYYAGKFPRSLTSLSPLSELALYILWALPIDALAIRCLVGPLDGATLGLLASLAGLTNDLDAPKILLAVIRGYGWWWCFVKYAGVIVASLAAGTIARRLVWASRWDVHVPMLRMQADWYYILQGRLPGLSRRLMPEADILVNHPEGSRLYAGVVDGFEPTGDGRIKEVFLIAARRHKKLPDGTTTLRDIPGDQLAIFGSTIHSINMRYYELPTPTAWWPRLGWRAKAWIKAFILEEP